MNGREKLEKSIRKLCDEGEGCFNPNGCNHEFCRKVPETDTWFIKHGIKTRCVHVAKCAHKYCDKYKWALDRAQQYADALGVSRDEVLDAWEARRNYCPENYYQEYNQPALDGKSKVIKESDWLVELRQRFGNNPSNWKFVCPSCGHVQSFADFEAIGEDPNLAYQCCIGRYTGSNDRTGEKGCNYTINGLISLNRTTVISSRYLPVKVFEMAPAPGYNVIE